MCVEGGEREPAIHRGCGPKKKDILTGCGQEEIMRVKLVKEVAASNYPQLNSQLTLTTLPSWIRACVNVGFDVHSFRAALARLSEAVVRSQALLMWHM